MDVGTIQGDKHRKKKCGEKGKGSDGDCSLGLATLEVLWPIWAWVGLGSSVSDVRSQGYY